MSSKSLSEKDSYVFGALSEQPANTAELPQAVASVSGAETQIQPMAGSIPSVEFGSQESADIYYWEPFTGTWNADFGTDGPAALDSLVITVTRPGCPAFTSPVTPGNDVEVIIDGTNYGTFRIDTNGTFVFQPMDETHAMLQLSLTAVDSDGDVTKSETITVCVSDPETGPGISHLGNITIDEANLPGGTNPDTEALTKEIVLGNKIIDIRTDIGGWVKEGDVFVLKSPEKYDADGNLINGFGELRYNADTNTLTYTLTNPMGHALGENAGMDVFLGVVVRARYQPEYPLDVIINIKDDGPLLTFGDGSDDELKSGDIFKGDWHHSFGADGPADVDSILLTVRNAQGESSQTALTIGVESSVIIDGINYGTILLKSDGSFTFQATPNTDNTLTFNLTITDSDGDSASSASFSLAVSTPVPPPVDYLETTVSEADLAWGTSGNTGDTVKNIDIPANYTIDTTGWGDTGNGVYIMFNSNNVGYLTYDKNTNTLTYTLGSPHSHGDPAASGADDVFKDGFKVTLTDEKGNLFELDAIIDVLDDAPELTMDAGSGEVQSGHVFIGAWSYSYGADGVDLDGTTLRVNDGSNEATFTVQYWHPFDVVVGGVYYGKAMISDAGEYIFQAAPNITANLNLAIGITDGDGDFREANDGGGVNINVVPATPPDLSDFGSKPNEWWSEAYLPDGTQGLDWSELTKHIEIPEGYAVDVSGWIHLGGDGDIYQLNGHFGYLKYSPEWNVLAYQLVARADHPDTDASGASDTVTDDFPVYIIDSMGNSWGTTLNLQVRDDAPSVEFGGNASEATSGYEFEGDWQAVFGADGASATGAFELKVNDGTNEAVFSMLPDSATAIVINGVNYGTLTLHSGNGKYTFVSTPDLDARLSFVLAVTDGDGDKAISNDGNGFEITITPPTPPATEISTGGEHFDEANLPEGTNSDSAALTKVIVMPEGYNPDLSSSEGWAQSGTVYTKEVTCGYLRYENGTLTYTLTSTAAHTEAGRDSLDINAGRIKLEDAKGNTCSVDLIIPLNDDVPTVEFVADDGDKADDFYSLIAENTVTGTLDIAGGADGLASVTIDGKDVTTGTVSNPTVIVSDAGTLSVWNSNGTLHYSYTAKTKKELGNKEAQDEFTVTVTDKDGDIASDTMTLHVYPRGKGIDDDDITLVNQKLIYANTIFGDSKAIVNKWNGGEGDQVYTDNTAGSGQIYVGGKKANDDSYWGHDTITLQSDRVDANTIYAGQGDDIVVFEGHPDSPSTHYSYGNTVYLDEHTIAGHMETGSDTLIIKGDSYGNSIYGDGRIAVATKGPVVLGDDRVEIHGNSYGESYYGDVYDASTQTVAGDDTYMVTGDSKGSSLFGDAYYMTIANSKAGNDVIQIKGNSDGESIFGDAYYLTGANSKAGNDTIAIGGDVKGNSIYGDGYTIGTGVTSGNDIIEIGGTSRGSSIYGDGYTMGTGSTGGHDVISIGGDSHGETIYGDAVSIGTGGSGGNDTITIGGTMYGGFVRGDSEGSYSDVRYGDDTITVGNIVGATTNRASVVIAGDSESSGVNVVFGNDRIEVGNVTNGTIKGDSTSGGHKAQFGDDTIIINGTVKNGWIMGDTESTGDSSQKFGNDYIEVNNFESGRIYGDASGGNGAQAGDDTIVVHKLSGTESKLIDGGQGGKDIFIYDNEDGNVIRLDDKGNVTIDGVTDTTNTEIKNFEGIGGGSGNDTLYGGAGNDYLNAGSGDNTLFGGSGADTFAWSKSSLGGKDQIMDFKTLEGDKLAFSDLLAEGESLSSFFEEHVSGLKLTNDDKLAFTITDNGLSKEVEIQFQAGDTNFEATVSEYHSAASTAAEEQILTNLLLSISTQ